MLKPCASIVYWEDKPSLALQDHNDCMHDPAWHSISRYELRMWSLVEINIERRKNQLVSSVMHSTDCVCILCPSLNPLRVALSLLRNWLSSRTFHLYIVYQVSWGPIWVVYNKRIRNPRWLVRVLFDDENEGPTLILKRLGVASNPHVVVKHDYHCPIGFSLFLHLL